MYSALIDAPIHTDLTLLEITSPKLASWLQRFGLFIGSTIIRHDEEVNYHPVRVRGTKGDVVVPAGLGIKVIVHSETGERKPLVEMKKKEKGHIETMSCGRGCIQALSRLGVEEDSDVVFIRSLPHMDYITLIDKIVRTRISEGEASRLWGKCEGEEETQFYFATKNKPFLVQEIIGGHQVKEHLKTHAIEPGASLVLENIEQTSELHKPGVTPVTISSAGGLRLYLNPAQAGKIIVKSADRENENHSPGQQHSDIDAETEGEK
jgi:Fe2+ transport system protein FeoA